MALPHYSQDQTSKKGMQYEPVQANLFEVTILPPDGVAGQEMLLQHVNTISGLAALHKDIAPVEQKYKFATRSYAGMIDSTSLDITVIRSYLTQTSLGKSYLLQGMAILLLLAVPLRKVMAVCTISCSLFLLDFYRKMEHRERPCGT